jgi:hypothetical protein
MDRDELDVRLAEIYGNRRWIVALDVAVAAHGVVETMRRFGAHEMMVVASSEGVGDLPDAPIHYTRTMGDTIIGAIRAYLSSIERPDAALASAIRTFDPHRTARVYSVPFGSVQAIEGRPVYGARPLEWEALEDKMVANELWAAAGIATAPFLLATPSQAAQADLASDLGSVWVADNREGWHGGGAYVRWVRDRAEAKRAAEWFDDHADRVRVMPFLDGIPCSIHGIVTGDGIAVLRPLEMIVLRMEDAPAFVYAGACSFWDPDDAGRAEMRDVARSVGEALRRRVGYLGAYGIDGVLTDDGFLPTELNPRLSAGHALPARSADLPLGMLIRAMVEGDIDLEAGWLEATLVGAGDATRGGGMGIPLGERYEARRTGLVFRDGAAAAAEDEAQAELALGPGPQGSFLMLRLDPEQVPAGPSAAPLAVAAIDFARREWGVALPQVSAAPDLRGAPRGR